MEGTLEVWRCMERCVPDSARHIGLSNMNLAQVEAICGIANVRPSTIQNRFLRRNDYDQKFRAYCSKEHIVYQAFSILRSKHRLLRSNLVGWVAEITGVTVEEALLNLVLSLGSDAADSICIMNGSKPPRRLKADLAAIEKLGRVPAFILKGFEEELHTP